MKWSKLKSMIDEKLNTNGIMDADIYWIGIDLDSTRIRVAINDDGQLDVVDYKCEAVKQSRGAV